MDFLSSCGYHAGWLCALCLLCILSIHLCVFLCLFLSFPVLALSACFWTIFCLLFAKFHSFSWGCSQTGSGPQIYTIQSIMDAKDTFSSWHFEDVYFNLLKKFLGHIFHVYTNLTAKWVVPHNLRFFAQDWILHKLADISSVEELISAISAWVHFKFIYL